MYWPWKWFECTIIVTFQHERTTVCSICYFGSLIRFAHFIIMVGGTPSLASPDGTSLIFYYTEFWATCACPEKRVCPEIFHCIEIFFIFQDFWATCACPEKQSAWIHCIEYIYFLSFRILNNLRLPWKTEFALKLFTLLNILFTIRIFEQLALALKNRVCPEFTVLNIHFLSFRILNNLRLPWKTVCPEIFHCIEIFLSFRIFEQAALSLKTEFDLKFFTALKYFLSFRIFQQVVLALKTEFALKFFKPGGRQPPPASYATVCYAHYTSAPNENFHWGWAAITTNGDGRSFHRTNDA